MSDCIFCKIIAGDIPSAKVFENEKVVAFLDLSQVTKGHTLVIPKIHKENIYELTPEIAGTLFSTVPVIAEAIKKEFNPQGMNLLNNNGSFAGQAVFHYHLHLIPRYDETDGYGTKWTTHQDDYSAEELQNIAAAIKNKLA